MENVDVFSWVLFWFRLNMALIISLCWFFFVRKCQCCFLSLIFFMVSWIFSLCCRISYLYWHFIYSADVILLTFEHSTWIFSSKLIYKRTLDFVYTAFLVVYQFFLGLLLFYYHSINLFFIVLVIISVGKYFLWPERYSNQNFANLPSSFENSADLRNTTRENSHM